jgi:hypothetical protein
LISLGIDNASGSFMVAVVLLIQPLASLVLKVKVFFVRLINIFDAWYGNGVFE